MLTRLLFFLFLVAAFFSVGAQIPEKELLADSLSQVEQYDDANAIYDRLHLQFAEEANYIAQLRVATKIAVNYQQLGRHEAALNLLQNVIAETEKKLKESAELAMARHKMGVSYYYLEREQEAIDQWKKALSIRREMLPPHHPDIVKGYRNIANAYSELKNYEAAQPAMLEAVNRNKANPEPDTTLLIQAYRELGFYFSQMEDLDQAKVYLDLSLSLAKRYLQEEPWEIAYNHTLFWFYFKRLNEPDSMTYHVRQSISLLQSIADKYDEDWWSLADNYHNLGSVYYLSGDLDQAQRFLKESLLINQRYPEERRAELARTYNSLSMVYRQQGQLTSAIEYNQRAIDLDRQAGNTLGLADGLNNRGELFFDRKEYQTALAFHQQSIALLVPGFDESDPSLNPSTESAVIGDRPDLIASLADKAEVLYHLALAEKEPAYLQQALTTYDTIAKFIDQVRRDFSSDKSKEFLATKAKAIYEQAIRTGLTLYRKTGNADLPDRILGFSERSKAVILLEAVRRARVRSKADIPPGHLARERQLHQSIGELEQHLFELQSTTPSSPEVLSLKSELTEQRRQLDALVDTFQTILPAHYQLLDQSPVEPIANIRTQLEADQAVIEYFTGEKQLFIFCLDQKKTEIFEIPLDFPLQEWVSNFRQSIYLPFTDPESDSREDDYADLGLRLYEKLLAPVSHRIGQKRKLILIPDGVLGYLPFDALLTQPVPEAATGQYHQYAFLGKASVLSYNYSLALLEEMRGADQRRSSGRLLAFAPVFQNSRPLRIGATQVQLPPLIYNQQYTEEVMSRYKGAVFLGAEATKEQFFDLAGQYRFLHLASHAQMNDQNSEYSFISFAQTGDAIQEDQLLFVHQLYNMPLQLEMVVLSACETALGKLRQGEGIISLARAFSYAGARSLITTQWQVNDQKTGQLIKAFYEALAADHTKDEALWLAKKQFIDSGVDVHPYYWAGFIPIGDMRKVKIQEAGQPLLYYAGLGLALLTGILYWRARRQTDPLKR